MRFTQAGLTDFAYKGPLGPSWPTLRELIASGRRASSS